MATEYVKQIGAVAKSMVEVLSRHPAGLGFNALLQEVAAPHSPTNGERSGATEAMQRGAIALIRAGWLLDHRGRWAVSEEGQRAHARHRDPETFVREAARHSVKGWLSVHSPYYLRVAKSVEKLTVEYKAIRRIGVRNIFGKSLGGAPWQDVLPIQKPRRVHIPGLSAGNLDELHRHLREAGVSYTEGGHALYLPPAAVAGSAFRVLASDYPPGVGVKIIKRPGEAAGNSYALGMTQGDSRLHLSLIHQPKHLGLVASLFYAEGVGPRPYDFVELKCGEQWWTAYVTEHVEGRTPTVAECEAGVGRLRELEQKGVFKVLLPEGFDDPEFECPSCSNNALVSADGRFHYVDFQNFLLTDYESYLTRIAQEASEKSHFGDQTVLRGGRYLYQSVPGVSLPGKRSIDDRVVVLRRLLQEAGVTVEERLVLDVGCNIGMMMAQYLKMGARWCHGWDRAHVTPHTERMLLALGCTRFSTTGGDISSAQPMEENVPAFLRPALDGCVLSYLAVREHIGWLDALSRLPWSFIIYEGHEGETQADFDEHMREFKAMADFRVGGSSFYTDGDSDRRPVAILVREPK
jgi:hypothetical protein